MVETYRAASLDFQGPLSKWPCLHDDHSSNTGLYVCV